MRLLHVFVAACADALGMLSHSIWEGLYGSVTDSIPESLSVPTSNPQSTPCLSCLLWPDQILCRATYGAMHGRNGTVHYARVGHAMWHRCDVWHHDQLTGCRRSTAEMCDIEHARKVATLVPHHHLSSVMPATLLSTTAAEPFAVQV